MGARGDKLKRKTAPRPANKKKPAGPIRPDELGVGHRSTTGNRRLARMTAFREDHDTPAGAAPARAGMTARRQLARKAGNRRTAHLFAAPTANEAKRDAGPNARDPRHRPDPRAAGAEAERDPAPPAIQRQAGEGETAQAPGVKRCPAAPAAGPGGRHVPPEIAARIAARRGGGRPLPSALRREMEASLGCELAGVRLHTDAAADRLCRALGARAFTIGTDIFFAHEQFDPGTASGRRLLAHELAHACQHDDGGAHGALDLSQPGDRSEKEADRAADHAIRQAPVA